MSQAILYEPVVDPPSDIGALFTTVGDEYLAYDLAHSTPNNSNVPDDILSGHRCKERAAPSSAFLRMAVALLDWWFRIEIEARLVRWRALHRGGWRPACRSGRSRLNGLGR